MRRGGMCFWMLRLLFLRIAWTCPIGSLILSLYLFTKCLVTRSGIGALIAREKCSLNLQRPWFAGGTITVASVQPERHYLADAPAAFEDGTLDYLNIPAVEIGIKHLESIGMDIIHESVRCLTGWLLDNLVEIKYSNGKPLVKIYGPISTDQRGGAIALNFVDPMEM